MPKLFTINNLLIVAIILCVFLVPYVSLNILASKVMFATWLALLAGAGVAALAYTLLTWLVIRLNTKTPKDEEE